MQCIHEYTHTHSPARSAAGKASSSNIGSGISTERIVGRAAVAKIYHIVCDFRLCISPHNTDGKHTRSHIVGVIMRALHANARVYAYTLS